MMPMPCGHRHAMTSSRIENSPPEQRRYSTMLSPMLSLLSVLWPLHVCFAGAFSIDAKWTDLSHQEVNIVTPPRSGHVAFAPLDEPYSPRIFGGYIEEKDGSTGEITRYAGNDMWRWGGVDRGWSKVDYADENVMPQPRLAAAMCLVNDRPVLFGGWDPQTPGTGGVVLDTLEEFDTKSTAWKANVIDARIPDGPTSRHVAVNLPDGTAIIHNHRCTDHVMIYSDSGFHKQSTTGPAPSSRGLHAATVAGNKAVIFGGAEQSGTMDNEVFMLDTRTWEWRQIQIENSKCIPCPRAAPCFVTAADNCVLLFGGAEATSTGLNPRGDLWALHFDPDEGVGRWELLVDDKGGGGSVLEGCPPPRNAATLSEIEPSPTSTTAEAWDVPAEDGEIRKSFVLQGGWHPFVRTYNDCFILSVSLKQ